MRVLLAAVMGLACGCGGEEVAEESAARRTECWATGDRTSSCPNADELCVAGDATTHDAGYGSCRAAAGTPACFVAHVFVLNLDGPPGVPGAPPWDVAASRPPRWPCARGGSDVTKKQITVAASRPPRWPCAHAFG